MRHVVDESRGGHRHALVGNVERDRLDGRADDRDPGFGASRICTERRRGHDARAALGRAGLREHEEVGGEITEHGLLRVTRGAGSDASLKVPRRDPHHPM